jgi:hypothetical protein
LRVGDHTSGTLKVASRALDSMLGDYALFDLSGTRWS